MACSVTAYLYVTSGNESPFILTGKVRPGLPDFGMPPFSTNLGNTTLGFVDMCNELGTAIVMVPIIAVLGNVAIAKAFGKFSFLFQLFLFTTYKGDICFC